MMLSFVEAFWVMGVIFLCMLPLLLLLRNPRKLHPHTATPKHDEAVWAAGPSGAPSSEQELVSSIH